MNCRHNKVKVVHTVTNSFVRYQRVHAGMANDSNSVVHNGFSAEGM